MKVSIGDGAVDVFVVGLDTLALLHRCCPVKFPGGEGHPIPPHPRTAKDVSGILEGSAAMTVRALKPLCLTLAHTTLMLENSSRMRTRLSTTETPRLLVRLKQFVFHLTIRASF
jgi:hypothetical protein